MDGVKMYIEIIFEIFMAIGRLFMNPIFYIAPIVAVAFGYFRVKKERRQFNTRIFLGWIELRGYWKEALFYSFVISIVSVFAGLTVTSTFLFIVSVFTIAGLVTGFISFLSASYIMPIAIGLIWVMFEGGLAYNLLGFTFAGSNIFEGLIVSVSILVGMLLIAESYLVKQTTAMYASPTIEKSKRGLSGIAYSMKKLWLLPIIFVIPGDAIPAFLPYWPKILLGENTFSIVAFPLIVGFSQFARHTLPVYLSPKIGRAVLFLGSAVLLFGAVSFFIPYVGIFALLLAFVGRLIISLVFKMQESSDNYAVAPKTQGVVIAAILPESPAEKMSLAIGETIVRVNGQDVSNTLQLYEALQTNAAHCRLEVVDHQNELRLAQQVIYSTDHHKIGLLLAEQEITQ